MSSRRQNVAPLIARSIALSLLLAGGAIQAAAAQTDAERTALLDRIRLLEQRLEQLERTPAPRPTRAAARPTAPASPAPASLPATAAPPAASPPPAEPAARLRDPREEEIPQEAFVFRDQAVTLRPGRAELSLDLGYLRDRRTVSSDRSGSAVVTGRVGLLDGVEASVTLPFFIATRSFEFSPTFVTDRETRAMGDVVTQVNIRGWGEREYRPGAVFTAALVAPTGPSPFFNPQQGITAQQVPVDITQFISTRAAWALRGGVQFFKTVDPLVIFGGIAYEYAFPVEQSGITFRPGWRISYNAGLSFALSDRSTLGFTFIGNYTAALQANTVRYRATASEAAVFRFSLVQRLAPGLWLEPSLGMGLVSESPNVQLGLGLRYRF